MRLYLALGIAFALFATQARAEYAEDKTALLALAEKAFAAVNSQDPDDWRAIQVDEGVSLAMRPAKDGPAGAFSMSLDNNAASYAEMKHDGHELLERWKGEPTVLIRGPIAVIWGEYEFFVDGEFSHCGVDSIDAVKLGGEWKIANFMWLVDRESCKRE